MWLSAHEVKGISMEINGGIDLLQENLKRQISNYWVQADFEVIKKALPKALERMADVLDALSLHNRYVWRNGIATFSPTHSVQYSIFLYLLANSISKMGGGMQEADCIYYLNKIMNSCDWFYAIELPKIFYAEHPLGSVLGRAQYGNRLFIYQGCTVGGNWNKDGVLSYPVIGENVLMYAGSSILGNCHIGDNVIISAGTKIINRDIPDDSIVFENAGELTIKQVGYGKIHKRQAHIWKD